ncbi:MAG TPA: GNAT family protein [Gaiellaceae bacterium]|nr:GNAT family protein [Gaiellaceae bacterium]
MAPRNRPSDPAPVRRGGLRGDARRHQGKGFATEAARAVVDWAFATAGMHRVVGRTEARNAASARVLEKLGMRLEAHFVENEWVKNEWQSELVYSVLDREWSASSSDRR